jgi:hypothetical protein
VSRSPEPRWRLLTKAAAKVQKGDFAKYFEIKRLLSSNRDCARQKLRRVFTSFYQLNVGGLTEAFKDRYFQLLFDCRPIGERDPYTPLLLELYQIRRRKGHRDLAPVS